MTTFSDMEWCKASEAEQMSVVKRATPDERDHILRDYDWSGVPVPVLGWVSAQQGVSLGAALSAFFNGDPMRFNYLAQRDIPVEFHGQCRLLDAICRRINAGFYLPGPQTKLDKVARLSAWLHYQQEDEIDHRRGRWVLDRDILEPFMAPESDRNAVETGEPRARTGRAVFGRLAQA